MNEGVLSFLKVISELVATLGALVVAAVALVQWRLALQQWKEATGQRQRELRWKQADQGRTLIDELCGKEGHHAYSALLMTDPRGEPYEDDTKKPTIRHKEVIAALEAEAPTGKAAFIQECFDDLFFYLERIELSLENGLVTFEDIRCPMEYYTQEMARHKTLYQEYIAELRQQRALRFLQRFESWQVAKPVSAGKE